MIKFDDTWWLRLFNTEAFLSSHVLLPPSQTTSSALKGAIQLGIGYTVGNLSSKPERDVLMQDFYVVESIFFPRLELGIWCSQTGCVSEAPHCTTIHMWNGRSLCWLVVLKRLLSSMCSGIFLYFSEGSNLTPAHHFPDFRFKTYAPVAFRYFRELFGIRPDDYLVRIDWRIAALPVILY